MNYRLVCRYIGIVSLLIGGSMAFSLPFAFPALSQRTYLPPAESFEVAGATGLALSMAISLSAGAILFVIGRRRVSRTLYLKEAMAVVGLSWVLATILGALPYVLSSTRTTDAARVVTMAEAMFESQSGFSTTGATILTDLETPSSVAHCILFWRSWTHFLGGLGIVVLFVAILGQGSAGKAIMRAEMPGPSKQSDTPRMQQAAWAFAGIYLSLNVILTAVYMLEGMSLFDGLCHAFGTMATGGFSTYNASHGRFDSALIDYTTVIFMIAAGTNFTLLYISIRGKPGKLLKDVEFRTYMAIIALVTAGIIFFGMRSGDEHFESFFESLRYGLFTVVSVITTTGYGTADFDTWNNFGRGILFLLMFVGGCAGSTGGGMKVIRHVLFFKILSLELERQHRPRVVRQLRVGDHTIDDPHLVSSIVSYFCVILAIFIIAWLLLITFEPIETWGGTDGTPDQKLLDSATAVAATLNNIGPGLGVVGATQNYAVFSQPAKLLFTFLMVLGRVEVFSVLVLLSPSFWRRV